MNTYTFPDAFLRHFIGLNHMDRMIAQQTPNYPPHNIEQIGEDKYVLSLAVAGFSENEINISLLNGALTISGEKITTSTDTKTVYLHRGLSQRNFSRTFSLAEHVNVISADLNNGILTIELERQVPESAKPKLIPIGLGKPIGQKEISSESTKLKKLLNLTEQAA